MSVRPMDWNMMVPIRTTQDTEPIDLRQKIRHKESIALVSVWPLTMASRQFELAI